MDDDNPFANPFADDNDVPAVSHSSTVLPPINTNTPTAAPTTGVSPNQSPYIRKLERDGIISSDSASPSSSGFSANPFSSGGDGNPFASSPIGAGMSGMAGGREGAEEIDAFSGGFGGGDMSYSLPPAATSAAVAVETPTYQTHPFHDAGDSSPLSPSARGINANADANANTSPEAEEEQKTQQAHNDAERLRALGLAPEVDPTAGLKAAFVKRSYSHSSTTKEAEAVRDDKEQESTAQVSDQVGAEEEDEEKGIVGGGESEKKKNGDLSTSEPESSEAAIPSNHSELNVTSGTANAESQRMSSQTQTQLPPSSASASASAQASTSDAASASVTKTSAPPIRRRKKIVGISVGDSERERERERAHEQERQKERERMESERAEKDRVEKERLQRERQTQKPHEGNANEQSAPDESQPISTLSNGGETSSSRLQDGQTDMSAANMKGADTADKVSATNTAEQLASATHGLVQETGRINLSGNAATNESLTDPDTQHQSEVDDGLRGLPALPESEAGTRTASPDISLPNVNVSATASATLFPTEATTLPNPPTSPPAKTVVRSPNVHSRRVVSGSGSGGGVWGRAFDEVENEPLSAAPVTSPLPGSAGWATTAGSGGWGGNDSADASGYGYGPGMSSSPGFAGMQEDRPLMGERQSSTASLKSTSLDSPHPAGSSSLPADEQRQGQPRTVKTKPSPAFNIRIHDPTRVGDPIRGHVVYTVTTRTTSPHFHASTTAQGAGGARGMVEASVLRRFSQFLWLVERLAANNPGVIVPPVPDKQISGRFEDQFVETRRAALEKCLNKIANHPVLALDPDLRLFLESESFEYEVKHRKHETTQSQDGGKGLLASIGGSIGGPRFVEKDDWFEQKKSFLDSLEAQMKSLIKSAETASKHRLDLATTISDFSQTITALSESDLSMDLSQALQRFAGLIIREKEREEGQAKMDVVWLLSTADEYLRWIGSVRLAFAGRIKSYHAWQQAESDSRRLKAAHEKLRRAGKIAHERLPLAIAEIHERDFSYPVDEINQADRKALDLHSDFDAVSRLCKTEFGAYEQGRVEEFKNMLGGYLDGMIVAQKEMIAAWENYLGLVQRTTGDRPTQRSS
ncbi:hypothetical protein QFC21_005804 [Naganishia friedmannii]|uniref:Uncharacterized protein n=1 Tax=Naganishia friedmannii TaxID=89922 RepID=A0ACC2V819_9TREE|nr:hypothetical protein QFC21_005804 [Naganishia friedmannii]